MTYAIYKITNKVTKHVYIGLTTLEKTIRTINTQAYGPQVHRFAEHLGGLRRQDHFNPFMQADYDAHGAGSFVFKVVEILPADMDELEALDIERAYIRGTRSPLYNIRNAKPQRFPRLSVNEAKVVKRLKRGELGKDIAEDLGVSTAAISLIKNRYGVNTRLDQQAKKVRKVKYALRHPVYLANGRVNLAATARKHGFNVCTFGGWLKFIKNHNL